MQIKAIGSHKGKPLTTVESKSKPKLLKSTVAFLILQRSLKFLSMIGLFIGVDYRLHWKRNGRFYITKGIVTFLWSQIFYTHFVYVYQHNSVRNCEVFAIYGIAVSVGRWIIVKCTKLNDCKSVGSFENPMLWKQCQKHLSSI